MNKNEMIDYLSKIKPFINLRAICDYYNSIYCDETIDYNNLRVVIKRQSETRLSEEKLASFINFLYKDLYKTVFLCENIQIQDVERINSIIDVGMCDIKEKIEREICHGIQNKRD